MLYIITGVAIITFVISFINDKRKLSNAFLFLVSLTLIFLSITSFVYDNHLDQIHKYLMIILYAFIPVSLILFAVFMIVNGFVILKKERKSLGNSLSILFGVAIIMYSSLSVLYFIYSPKILIRNLSLNTFIHYGYAIMSFFFIVFIFIFFSFLIYSILYLNLPKRKDYDYIIIHGSGLIDGYIVPPLLASRIDKALEAYRLAEKDDVKFIASGGQGLDEKISEAKAIANYLIEKGIKKEKIILEDKSTTTYENLKYSQRIVRKQKNNPKYLFVSNNYHIFRAALYARRLGMNGEGVGSKTAGYYIPSAFLREYVAILNKIKWILISISIVFLFFVYISR